MKYVQLYLIFIHIYLIFTLCESDMDIKEKRSVFQEFLESDEIEDFKVCERNKKVNNEEKDIKIDNKENEMDSETDTKAIHIEKDTIENKIEFELDTKENDIGMEIDNKEIEMKLNLKNEELIKKSTKSRDDKQNKESQETKDSIGPNKTLPTFKRIKLPSFEHKQNVGEIKTVILPGDMEAQIKVLSSNPFIFEVDHFLDEEECELLIDLAKVKQLKPIINKIPEVQLKTPELTFEDWDYNQDGTITVDEIVLLPGLSGLNYTNDDADDMLFLLRMDPDNNKQITLEELRNTDFSQLKAYFTRLRNDESRHRDVKSQGSWVWHDEDELLKYHRDGYFEGYHERISFLTGLPKEIIEESEPLQVRQFEKGQYQFARHDSEPMTKDLPCCLYGDVGKVCRQCRYISMSVFLNDDVEGGQLSFPLANTNYQDILQNSGEWRGYFIYAKTTGNKFYFRINITFSLDGANRVFKAAGVDESGDFLFTNGIVIDNTVKFVKIYNSEVSSDGIKYQGKLSDGNKISGYWWISGQKRSRGTFFMWNKNYDVFSSTAIDSSNTIKGCSKSSLIIQPKKGKAIFWYNHQLNPQDNMLGEFNQESLYAQCEVTKGHKWIASTWINIIGDGDLELRAWRRGSNFLTDSQKRKNIFEKLGTNENKLSFEYYESEYLEEITGKNHTNGDNLDGYYRHKPASSSLQALQILMNDMNREQLRLLASNVHKKLGLTCIPMGAVGGGGGM